jgi:broad specificity phosphatase PhoE
MVVHITYFVHGTTTDNVENKATGWLPGELSDLGKEQSVQLREQTAHKKFDVVICSDLKRAIDSAEITWKGIYPIIHDKRLRECNYGELNGTSDAEEEKEDHIDKPFPHGESYRDVEKRIRSFLDDLKKKYDGKSVAIVAHQAPQLAMEVVLLHKSWKEAFATDWRKRKAWQPGWEYKA